MYGSDNPEGMGVLWGWKPRGNQAINNQTKLSLEFNSLKKTV